VSKHSRSNRNLILGENRSIRRKTRKRTKNKRNSSTSTSTSRFEPGPHWWEASAFTTEPPVFPLHLPLPSSILITVSSQSTNCPLSYVQTNMATPNIVGPTMLEFVASVLAVVCKQMQQLPTTLRPAVHYGKDTTHMALETMCNARTWSQQCWKSCANASNIVELNFGDHETEEMLGVIFSKV